MDGAPPIAGGEGMSAPANSRAAAAAAQVAPTRGTKQGGTAGKTVSIAPDEKLSLVARAKPSCSGHPMLKQNGPIDGEMKKSMCTVTLME